MSPIEIFFFGFAALVVAVALIAGQVPEKISGALILFVTIASQIISLFVPHSQQGVALLAVDGIMALGFTFLALNYMKFWTAVMMFAISGYFYTHAYYMSTSRSLDRDFAFFSNIATAVALLALALGVWSSRRRSSGRT
ncbi:hypothetical protein [Phenylobacterium sp.]|jgi:hypothetical protein|uniref:hypothetical protein n=1 Tax=Phenylobacterium sp. TaxID=1871053 RepID=UPI0025D1AB2B|nr:hypothetical protein [Phenylobacterium sp.]MCA6286783.1 hypothetical protein [Phenylobacterium sp.]MCA6288594.1 hypothetical protein [Phenylobacterium sp.]MCA6311508.1 hypothetical protein [Phenylobacterium sp.]MCA6324510.1 hypothetical protein [Phenylobacterium sp.]MCA6338412.1 hypothetical protein [Phenylobacterium sp.]